MEKMNGVRSLKKIQHSDVNFIYNASGVPKKS